MGLPPPITERELHSVMSPNPVVVDRATTLDQALDLLEGYQIRHLPVVECNRVLGMISDRDLRLATGFFPAERRLTDEQGRPLPGPRCVGDVMRQPVHTLPEEAVVSDALACLLELGIGAVPVLAGDCLAGLVTETDLLRLFGELRGALGSDAPALEHQRCPMGTVAPDTPLLEASELLARNDQHLGVIEAGQLVGLVSERDVSVGLARAVILAARAGSERRTALEAARVRDVMTTRLVTVAPKTPLWRCAGRMLDHRISALPVLAGEQVQGILTVRGILAHFWRSTRQGRPAKA